MQPSPDRVAPRAAPGAKVTVQPRAWTPPQIEDAMRVAGRMFQSEVTRVSAPGGMTRPSLRLQFADERKVIVTRRADPERHRREADLLRALDGAKGAVPRLLGLEGAFLFQQDAGPLRLSVALAQTSGDARLKLARAALVGLEDAREAAARRHATERLVPIALSMDWVAGIVGGPMRLAGMLGLDEPQLDLLALGMSLMVDAPQQLVKWDARPGNAAVQPDGRVVWFDWEEAGLRGGFEDAALLFGDEFWPIGFSESLALLSGLRRGVGRQIPLIRRLTALQMVDRLLQIRRQWMSSGPLEARDAMRHDQPGADPRLVADLAARGREIADRDRLLTPLLPLFEHVAQVPWSQERQGRLLPA